MTALRFHSIWARHGAFSGFGLGPRTSVVGLGTATTATRLSARRFASAAPPPPPFSNAKAAAAATKIFGAIQRDPELTALCMRLSVKLGEKGIIDPRNPTRQPGMKELLKIATDKEITTLLTDVMRRLKASGILDDDAVKASMDAAAGSSGGTGIMGALLGVGGSGTPQETPATSSGTQRMKGISSPRGVEEAEFVDANVGVENDEQKKPGLAAKVKGLFKK